MSDCLNYLQIIQEGFFLAATSLATISDQRTRNKKGKTKTPSISRSYFWLIDFIGSHLIRLSLNLKTQVQTVTVRFQESTLWQDLLHQTACYTSKLD